uniref:Uncharacterized protein n=1 Tax=viral metagenome TaxID=1070528 RepID=A0A6C0BB57_9ZZZZ
MPTAIYDSSLNTRIKQSRTLYNYNQSLINARVGNPNITLREQPTDQRAVIPLTRKLGSMVDQRATVPGLAGGVDSN